MFQILECWVSVRDFLDDFLFKSFILKLGSLSLTLRSSFPLVSLVVLYNHLITLLTDKIFFYLNSSKFLLCLIICYYRISYLCLSKLPFISNMKHYIRIIYNYLYKRSYPYIYWFCHF